MYQQLGDAERVNEIIGMMQTVFDSEMPSSRTYDHDREILADVRQFAEGKYNLSRAVSTVRKSRLQKPLASFSR